jgi:hypothetical protein
VPTIRSARAPARSYEPLICVEARCGLLWAGAQRPGGSPGTDDVVPMLDQCWAVAPASIRERRVRADHSFSSAPTLHWLEDRRAQYAIVARVTAPLTRRLIARRYRAVSPGWEVADMRYQAVGWTQKRRIVAVRKALDPRDPQPTLFVRGRYGYHAYVTNLDLRGESVWHFYNDRARLELIIKEHSCPN